MEAALRALAHPARRRILQLVLEGEHSSGDLADAAGLTAPAASQHLRLLRDAELVAVRVDGNRRWYTARADRLAEVRAALDAFWGDRLGDLKARLERGGDRAQPRSRRGRRPSPSSWPRPQAAPRSR